LRYTGELPRPVNGPGGVGVPVSFPVTTGKIDDCHQELGKPEAWACMKETPDAVFQTSTCTHTTGSSVIVSLGQGTLEFKNVNVAAGVNAQVFESDHITKLSGPQFMAELAAGLDINNLTPLATTGFLTGNGAGYFDGGTQTINGVGGGLTV
jgi:hypothetical protein